MGNPTQPSVAMKSFDSLFTLGPYQYFYIFLWQMEAFNNWAQFCVLFYAGARPNVLECVDQNITASYKEVCNMVKSGNCSEYAIPDGSYDFLSPVIEWDLLCTKFNIFFTIAVCQMMGLLLGSPIAGICSDRFGRHKVVSIIWAWLILVGIGTSFAQNIRMLFVSRFMAGFGLGGLFGSSFVLFSESLQNRERLWIRSAGGIQIAQVVMAFVCWLCFDWRTLTLYTSLFSIPFMLLFALIISESPRWLLQRGRIEDARKALKKIVYSWNKREDNPEMKIDQIIDDLIAEGQYTDLLTENEDHNGMKEKRNYWFIHLFYTPELAKYTLVMMLFWTTAALIAYGNQLNVVQLAGNIYINNLISGSLRLLSSILIVVADVSFKKCGRRMLKAVGMGSLVVLSTLIAIAISIESKDTIYPQIVRGLNLLCGLFINPIWCVAYLMTSELYPTVIRTQANGLCSVFARVGSTVAPFLLKLVTDSIAFLGNKSWAGYPFAIMAGAALIELIIFMIFIPETRGKLLPDKMPERKKKEQDAEAKEPLTERTLDN